MNNLIDTLPHTWNRFFIFEKISWEQCNDYYDVALQEFHVIHMQNGLRVASCGLGLQWKSIHNSHWGTLIGWNREFIKDSPKIRAKMLKSQKYV